MKKVTRAELQEREKASQRPNPDEALAGIRNLLIAWEPDEDAADDRLNDILQKDKTLDLFIERGNYERAVHRLEQGPASGLIAESELDELCDYLVVERGA